MNDFLHSLRNGKDKRFDRNRRPYINPQFRDTEWRNGNDHKRTGYRKNNQPENMVAIKGLLEDIVKNQQRFADAEERVADAVERIAEALTYWGLPKPPETEAKAESVEQTVAPDAMAAVDAVDAVAAVAAVEPMEFENAEPYPEAAESNPVDRNGILGIVLEMREGGNTYGKIAHYLEMNQIPTLSGKGQWSAQSVHRLHKQHLQ